MNDKQIGIMRENMLRCSVDFMAIVDGNNSLILYEIVRGENYVKILKHKKRIF